MLGLALFMASTRDDKNTPGRRSSGRHADVDTDTEDGRAFLQDRLSLFGKWFFFLVLTFYLLANLPLNVWMGEEEFDWVNEWFGYKELLTLGTILVAGGMWTLTRGKALPATRLLWIDAIGPILVTTLASCILLEPAPVEGQVFQIFVILLACSNLLTVRAIIVPSTVERTLVISIVAFVPVVVIVAFSILANAEFSPVKAAHTGLAPLMWGGVAVASAAVTSRILFRLRGQVSQAAKLGHYFLEDEIGQGGMGVVYKARHATLRRPTAIKLLSPDRNQEEDLLRFELEVQWTATLSHPNTVAVYDYGRTPDGVFYCVMEYVEGVTLQDLVDGWGPVSPGRVVHILRQVCGALAEAHESGIIHRDVKPANIMLCERGRIPDVVKVLDFGLVKDTQEKLEDPGLSAMGTVIGTPAYLSPEAVEDPESIDLRSDIYALGAVGYFLLTGTRLFSGETAVSLCVKHLTEKPERPSDRLGTSLPTDLEDVVLRCLAKDPADRFADAKTLAEALGDCASAGDWTEKDASSWWAESESQRKRPKGKSRGKTVAIDLTGRTPRDPAPIEL
jgi:serine/threonine-protein kinase